MSALLWWVVRQTSRFRWRREEAYANEADAQRAARFYRREYRRAVRVVPPGMPS